MQVRRLGRQTVTFGDPVGVVSWASVVGRMEGSGPLGGSFDLVNEDSFFGQATWEQAEARMQAEALELALQKGGLTAEDVDCVFAGDLLNQNIGATFGLRDYGIPFYGDGEGWQRQLHIYVNPFYYIDYCLAQTCALQYKVKMDADFTEAWKSYLKLCRLSASDFYTNMIKKVGLDSPFEPGCVKNIVEKLEKYVK